MPNGPLSDDAPEFATPRQRAQIGALVADSLDRLPFAMAQAVLENPTAAALREIVNTALTAYNRSMKLQLHSDASRLVTIEPGSILKVDRSDSPGYLDFSVEAYKTRFLRIDRGRSLAGIPIETPSREPVETVDLTKVTRVLMLEPGETSIPSAENLRRIRESGGKTLLDIRFMEEFLRQPWLIPEEFRTGYTTIFWGTILPDARGEPFVAGIRLRGDGTWGSEFHWVPHALCDCHFAACLQD